jgi:1-aminocyclopropane-1-carboxylate deaminase
MDQQSPLIELKLPEFASYRLFMKRDDLLHPQIQGNKWRKLEELLKQQSGSGKTVISFGGAFSNHLHALAYAGNFAGFPTVGILRGSSVDTNNPTLLDAQRWGMKLIPVPKAEYELLKTKPVGHLLSCLGLDTGSEYHLLPEGGDTRDALVGCKRIAVEILAQLPVDAGNPIYFCVPAGTGCTATGLLAGAGAAAKTLVFPAAPYGVDESSIRARLANAGCSENVDFEVLEDVFPGKFAQMTAELMAFIERFRQLTGILLDPIYTSKMFFKLEKMAAQKYFPTGSCIVAVHTGGLQGWRGYSNHFK